MADPAERPQARSTGLFERAQRVIPGGVNSPVRAFRSVGGTPYFVERGEGAYVWDVDGNRYIDFVQSYGASIVGHAHPKVVEAIRAAAEEGTMLKLCSSWFRAGNLTQNAPVWYGNVWYAS